jgi:hypothetical protein
MLLSLKTIIMILKMTKPTENDTYRDKKSEMPVALKVEHAFQPEIPLDISMEAQKIAQKITEQSADLEQDNAVETGEQEIETSEDNSKSEGEKKSKKEREKLTKLAAFQRMNETSRRVAVARTAAANRRGGARAGAANDEMQRVRDEEIKQSFLKRLEQENNQSSGVSR